MYSIFFDGMGNVTQIIVPRGKTVTGNFYATEYLSAVEKTYMSIRPSRTCKAMRLLHDNARPHKTRQIKEKIENMGLIELEHPPYIPDLSHCDFWLFDILKESLAGRQFDNNVRVGTAIYKCLHDIPKDEYRKTFYKWLERLRLCIHNKGDYFE